MNIPILWIALIAGIVGVLIGVIYWGETQKKGKKIRNIFMFLGIAGLVVSGLAWGNIIPQTYTTTEREPSPLAIGEDIVCGDGICSVGETCTNDCGTQICAVEDTSVTLSGEDAYLSTASGGSHRYRINGNIATVTSDAGTFTASPGNKIEVLWMNGTTTSYFSKVATYTVPCKGTYPITEKLSMNGTLTSRVYNTDNVLITGVASANQSLSAGDVKSLKLEFEQAYQKDVPYGSIAVVEYNTTLFDDVIIQSNGVELPTATAPQSYAITYGAESGKKAYLMPELISNKISSFTVVLDVDDSNSPVGAKGNVLIANYYRNYFINDKNGGAFEGPSAEDEYQAVTRTAGPTTTIYVN